MTHVSFTQWEAKRRLEDGDEALTHILLDYRNYEDKHVKEMLDMLLEQPNTIQVLWMECNQLTDKTGAKLAELVRESTTLTDLFIDGNWFTEQTIFAIADALLYNTTLRSFGIAGCGRSDQKLVDTAFAAVFKMNVQTPLQLLRISQYEVDDSRRVKKIASEMPHTSMTNILLYFLNAPAKISRAKIRH